MILSKNLLTRRTFLGGLYLLFGTGWAISAISTGYSTAIFEALFLGSSAFALWLRGIDRQARPILAISIIYLSLSAAISIWARGTHPLDFVLAFKSIYYVILLCAFCGKDIFRPKDVAALHRFLLFVFLVVYAVKRFGLGHDRPIVLIENNFELIFLSLVFYANYIATGRLNFADILALIAIVALSGSRSSAVAAVIVLVFCINPTKLRGRDIIAIVGVAAVGLAAAYVFMARTATGLAGIDRLRFLNYFFESTDHWNFWDFLVGAPRLTPLSDTACRALAFYENLFSYSGDGTCYSVILHSFNLRVIYDHGLLGAAFLYAAVWIVLGRQSLRVKLCVALVLFATGMSVSALNNVYAVAPIAILAALATAPTDSRKSAQRSS